MELQDFLDDLREHLEEVQDLIDDKAAEASVDDALSKLFAFMYVALKRQGALERAEAAASKMTGGD